MEKQKRRCFYTRRSAHRSDRSIFSELRVRYRPGGQGGVENAPLAAVLGPSGSDEALLHALVPVQPPRSPMCRPCVGISSPVGGSAQTLPKRRIPSLRYIHTKVGTLELLSTSERLMENLMKFANNWC